MAAKLADFLGDAAQYARHTANQNDQHDHVERRADRVHGLDEFSHGDLPRVRICPHRTAIRALFAYGAPFLGKSENSFAMAVADSLSRPIAASGPKVRHTNRVVPAKRTAES